MQKHRDLRISSQLVINWATSFPLFKTSVAARVVLLLFAMMSSVRAFPQQNMVRLPQTPRPVREGAAQYVSHYQSGRTLRLAIGLLPPHLAEEEHFLEELQDHNSPDFQHYLTPQQWAARFAPSREDEQALVDWIQSQGIRVTHRYPNRLLVDVQAPAGTIEKAFQVSLNSYRIGSSTFFSNDRDPSLPAALAGIVQSIIGLNSMQVMHPHTVGADGLPYRDYVPGAVVSRTNPLRQHGDRHKLPALKSAHQGSDGPNTNGFYDPTDLYGPSAYDFSALYALGHCCNPLGNPNSSPAQTSIAIATAGDMNPSDMYGFQAKYPYLAFNIERIFIDGTPACCDLETTLDTEWATAMSNSFGLYANTSEVFVYEAANPSLATFTDVYNFMLTDGYARVFSTSWGCAESPNCYDVPTMNTDHAIFNEMAGEGWTLVAASDDNGATAKGAGGTCIAADSVEYPASDPNIVAAGGTELDTYGGTFFSEVAWSGGTSPGSCNSNNGGSGGGCSSVFAAPGYQTNYPCGVGSRSVPDISLNAHYGQNIYFNGVLQAVAGTSIVAPELAGFFAQENAYLLYVQSLGTIGNANPWLYFIATNPSYAYHNPFYDITSGCNSNDVTQTFGLPYYCAGAGYDMVTGWGSANMLQLAWAFNTYYGGDAFNPKISFAGPPIDHWYNGATTSWTVQNSAGLNINTASGVAGFSYQWDSPLSDPTGEPTPGCCSSFYSGPEFANVTEGSASLNSSGTQGCHTLYVLAWDNRGRASGNQTYGRLCWDSVPPTTSFSVSPAPNSAGWNKSAVTVTLTSSDPGASEGTGSGVLRTYYTGLNTSCYPAPAYVAKCHIYHSPVTITSQGEHYILYFSEDVAGNFSAEMVGYALIDETAPQTKAILSGKLNGGVYYGPVEVKLKATDNLSGVSETRYRIDGGANSIYSTPFTVSTVGNHTVAFWSIDVAGNVEVRQSVTFTIN